MKANRKFAAEVDAVSPVIAVILMVAITVVLAATVFVLVSNIGSQSAKAAPQIGWTDDTSSVRFVVTQAPTSVNWNDFKIKSSDASLKYLLNGKNAAQSGTTAEAMGTNYPTTGIATTAGGTVMQGGDQLKFCAASTITSVTVTILHSPSNAVAHQFTFPTVAQTSCA